MPSTIREFVDRLAPTQIIPRAELDAVVDREYAGNRDCESTALAADLVRRGRISSFQAERLSRNEALLIDDYVLLEQRGAGGMAQVFKARHRIMHRIVALKLIRERQNAGRQAIGRFQREIKAVAALDHPHIVRAYDAGEADGTYFLVMEYVEGEDLAHVVHRTGAVPPDKAVDYVRQAAVGLEYAHQQGIIHRDIKPSNLMLTPEERVRVLDLGLARLQHPAEVTAEDVTDAVTETGDLLGTAAYMAPEQSRDPHLVDHRCDIYSLGCTLYFLLTGRTVYGGSSYVEKVLAHRQAAPPPLKIESGELPVELQSVFHRMIAKDPADRFQSMREVADALQRVSNSPEVTASETAVAPLSSTSRTSQQRLVWAATILACAGVAVLLVVLRNDDNGQPIEPSGPAAQAVAPGSTNDGDDSHGGSAIHSDMPVVGSESDARRIAGRILQRGGLVDVTAGEELLSGIAAVERLPPGDFQIVRVTLAGSDVRDSDLEDFDRLSSLQYLNLADSNVSSTGIRLLHGASQLKTLYLSSTQVDNSSMQVVSQLPSLEELDLRNTLVDDAGLNELSRCKSLRVLRLGEGQPLTPGALAILGEMTWLTSLGLRGAPVDDDGVEQLSKLSGLTWLDLGSTSITDNSAGHFIHFAHLSRLILDGTGITREQIEMLRESLPQCEVSD